MEKESKQNIINTCEGRKIFWVNVTNDNDVYVNNEGKFYHYKFFDDGKRLELKAWGDIYDL